MNKIMAGLLGIALASMGGLVYGADGDQTPAAQANTPSEVFGEQTRTWLELQRSGQVAGHPQPVSSDVANRIYKRYADSFSQPIPALRESGDGWSGSSR